MKCLSLLQNLRVFFRAFRNLTSVSVISCRWSCHIFDQVYLNKHYMFKYKLTKIRTCRKSIHHKTVKTFFNIVFFPNWTNYWYCFFSSGKSVTMWYVFIVGGCSNSWTVINILNTFCLQICHLQIIWMFCVVRRASVRAGRGAFFKKIREFCIFNWSFHFYNLFVVWFDTLDGFSFISWFTQ